MKWPTVLVKMIRTILKRLDNLDYRMANSQLTGRVADIRDGRVRVEIAAQGADGKPVLSPWVQMQEAAGGTGTNMPVAKGDPVRLLSVNGEIGAASLAIRDSYTDDERNPARSLDELVISYGGGALRMTVEELLITHGDNSIRFTSAGVTISHGSTAVELTDIVRILSSDLVHNEKSVGDTHRHGGVRSGGETTSNPVKPPLKEP